MVGGGVALIVFIFYFVPAWLPEDLTDKVELKRNMLLHQKELIGQEDSFKTRITAAEQRLAQDMNRLLPGDNAGSAGPALQKILQDLADSQQVEVSRKTPVPEQKLPDGLIKVTVQLDINCTLEQLTRFITAIENHDKFLKVDELTLWGQRIRNREEIRPSLKVAGLVATAPAAAKTAEKTPEGK